MPRAVSRTRSYGESMARVGGRNGFVSWTVGLLCAAVIAGLLYIAAPMMPTFVDVVGDTLRGATP